MKLDFKNWIINENSKQDSEEDWDFGHPAKAADYPYAVRDVLDFYYLQWEWERSKEIGRQIHNIDMDSVVNRKYTTMQSKDMPDDKSWVHKPDKDENPIEAIKDDLTLLGISKDKDPVSLIDRISYGKRFSSEGLDLTNLPPHPVWRKNDLTKTFKDDFPPLEDLDTNWMDKDWGYNKEK